MVAVSGHMGRGMAAQQILEELASRKELGNKVRGGLTVDIVQARVGDMGFYGGAVCRGTNRGVRGRAGQVFVSPYLLTTTLSGSRTKELTRMHVLLSYLQVRRWITEGVHVGASDQVYMSWGRRLLTSTEFMVSHGAGGLSSW